MGEKKRWETVATYYNIAVLQQIRKEIEEDMHKAVEVKNPNTEFAFGLQHALDIIDKHIEEIDE